MLSISSSEKLRKEFSIEGSGIPFRAAGLISIMLDTQRHDLMSAINSVVTDKNDRNKTYEKYLLDPAKLLDEAVLPPVFQVTSEEDLIRKDSLKLNAFLTEKGLQHKMIDFPRGKERKLVHVFPVCYPMYPESRKVFSEMDVFFKDNGGC